MRILHTESSLNWGGKELRALEEVRWLNNHGYEAWIAARPDSKILEWAIKWNLPYFIIPFHGVVSPVAIYKLLSLVVQYKFDLIDCHDAHDALHCAFMRMLGIKVVRTLHSESLGKKLIKRLIWRYGNDRIIVVSEVLKKRLIEIALPPTKIDIINEGIELTEFDFRLTGEAIRREFNIPLSDKIIVNIGMIRPNKGQCYLIEAADEIVKSIPNVRFLIVGEATRQEYEQQLQACLNHSAHRDKFMMTGYRTDIANLIAAADCVVISSLAEAHSRVVPQAFAMKRPVVATNVGGLPEFVKPEITGVLVQSGNASDLALGVVHMLQTDSTNMIENAYLMAQERFQIDGMMRKTLVSYTQALNKP